MSDCDDQWKLDVNDRYSKAVGIVISLASASLFLPILFLKDIAGISSTQSIADSLSIWVYTGWGLLALSVISGVLYFFFSAKWVKLAWNKDTDILGVKVSEPAVELLLDGSYFLMMTGFVLGITALITFMTTYTRVS